MAGTQIGFTIGDPAIPANANHAAQVAAYDALGYTYGVGCFITTPPASIRDWNVSTEDPTICSSGTAIVEQFKTTRLSPNLTIGGFMDYAEALIQLFFTQQAINADHGVLEIIHPNGTDKIFQEVSVKQFGSDSTNVEGRSNFNVELIAKKWPVFSALAD